MLAWQLIFTINECQWRNEQLWDWVYRFMFLPKWFFLNSGVMIECRILPVDPSGWQVSVESANYVAAMLANTLGATEGVLRIAAVGSDFKLFLKVKLWRTTTQPLSHWVPRGTCLRKKLANWHPLNTGILYRWTFSEKQIVLCWDHPSSMSKQKPKGMMWSNFLLPMFTPNNIVHISIYHYRQK